MFAITKMNQDFLWTDKCQQAFEEVKVLFEKRVVLALPQKGVPFDVWTDASGYAIGGVLNQAGRPITFENCKLENN